MGGSARYRPGIWIALTLVGVVSAIMGWRAAHDTDAWILVPVFGIWAMGSIVFALSSVAALVEQTRRLGRPPQGRGEQMGVAATAFLAVAALVLAGWVLVWFVQLSSAPVGPPTGIVWLLVFEGSCIALGLRGLAVVAALAPHPEGMEPAVVPLWRGVLGVVAGIVLGLTLTAAPYGLQLVPVPLDIASWFRLLGTGVLCDIAFVAALAPLVEHCRRDWHGIRTGLAAVGFVCAVLALVYGVTLLPLPDPVGGPMRMYASYALPLSPSFNLFQPVAVAYLLLQSVVLGASAAAVPRRQEVQEVPRGVGE